jgi:uncharacterized protein YbaP (TraB family)
MTMNRYVRRLLIFLTAVVLVFSSACPTLAREGRDSASGKHFLWSVEGDRNTVYFLGSIHILKSDAYPLPGEFESVYRKARILVFEADLEGMNDPGSQDMMIKLGSYPAGQSLSKNISRKTYDLLKIKFNELGLSVARFEQFRPWLVAQQVASIKLIQLGFDPTLGLDAYFYKKAKRDKKELVFLETSEYQINLFAGLNKLRQEEMLRQILSDLEVVEDNSSRMIDSWEKGDIDKFESFIKMSYEEYPDLLNRLLINRNKRWISNIQKLMKQDDDVLIIVGAGHLVGKDSVIDLLERKGYTARQR